MSAKLRLLQEREEQSKQWASFISDREKLDKEKHALKKKEKNLKELDKWCNSERDKL